jgi:hypothetical protein
MRLSEETQNFISRIGHWYLEEKSTYIRILGAFGEQHLLLACVLDRLVLEEICYQNILQGFNASLEKNKKREFIPYGLYVGYHFVKDTTHVRKEDKN